MNPELQRALKLALDSAEKISTAAWDELPKVIADILMAGLISSFMWIALGVVLLLVAFVVFRARRRAVAEGRNDDREMFTFMGGLMLVIASIILCVATRYVLVIWFAPRAYILELVM